MYHKLMRVIQSALLFARPPFLAAKPFSEPILGSICFDFHGVVLVTEKGPHIPLGIFSAEFSNGAEFLILFNVIGFMAQQYQQVTILSLVGLPQVNNVTEGLAGQLVHNGDGPSVQDLVVIQQLGLVNDLYVTGVDSPLFQPWGQPFFLVGDSRDTAASGLDGCCFARFLLPEGEMF